MVEWKLLCLGVFPQEAIAWLRCTRLVAVLIKLAHFQIHGCSRFGLSFIQMWMSGSKNNKVADK